jgi:antitoxin component YwqK of YwqJK toxin-antitoxin module
MTDKKDKPIISKWNDFSAVDFEPFTGFNTERYENGEKKEEGNFKDGKKVGKWTYYNKYGSIKDTKEH